MSRTTSPPVLTHIQQTPCGVLAAGTLCNGEEVTIRCLQPEDGPLYKEFLYSLPSATLWKRYHGHVDREATFIKALSAFDEGRSRVLGAFNTQDNLIGIAELFSDPAHRLIEVAYVAKQTGTGVGELLTQTTFKSCATQVCGRECPLGRHDLQLFVDLQANKAMVKIIENHPAKDGKSGFLLLERSGQEATYGFSPNASLPTAQPA